MPHLDALAETVRHALASGGPAAAETVEEAVAAYADAYSAHEPALMFRSVRDSRAAIGDALTHALTDTVATRLQDAAGWASALLANLAQHLGRDGDARTHLASAHLLAGTVGDCRLICNVRGLQAMLARDTGDLAAAIRLADDAYAHAASRADRVKAAAWARARTLAAMGDQTGADAALADARDAFDGDVPGRFGIDVAELLLHEAEVYLALGRVGAAQVAARASAATVATSRPAWAAARLTAAQAMAAAGDLANAGAVAEDVLDRHAPERIRATSRRRLAGIVAGGRLPDLAERVAALPALEA